jgi:hypothetical protein
MHRLADLVFVLQTRKEDYTDSPPRRQRHRDLVPTLA